MKNIFSKIVLPSILTLGAITGCSNDSSEISQKHIYSGKLENEKGKSEYAEVYLKKELFHNLAIPFEVKTFEIYFDKRDKSGCPYFVCYEDRNDNEDLDKIWINGEDYSKEEYVMNLAKKRYALYRKQIFKSKTKELINKL